MKITLTVLIGLCFVQNLYSQFAPPVGTDGTTAVYKDSSAIVGWASEVVSFERGLEDIAFPGGLYASFGDSSNAVGYAEGTSVDVVSLGDYGSIVLTFEYSIRNNEGPDFAVFENSFADDYLEFAHVEVSTDGVRFVRFPSISNIPTDEQTPTYGNSITSLVHNLAGKYRQGYGTPFDLEDLVDSSGIDLNDIRFVKIIDVVGSIDPAYGTYDSQGHIINDPYKTDFESGGFDLDGVCVMSSNNPYLNIKSEDLVNFEMYPNPTNGLVNVRVSEPIQAVLIYDLAGNIICDLGVCTNFDLSNIHISKGIYIVEIRTIQGQIKRSKLIFN